MTRPEKGEMVEQQLMMMAKSGKLQGQVGESQLVQMLEAMGAEEEKKVVVNRKPSAFDNSDDDDDNDDDFY
jgi:DNA-binding TFAR19-related protein (PDSD5 family)